MITSVTRKACHQTWTRETRGEVATQTLPLWHVRATASFWGQCPCCPMGRDFLHRSDSVARNRGGWEGVSAWSSEIRATVPGPPDSLSCPLSCLLSSKATLHRGLWQFSQVTGTVLCATQTLCFYRVPGLWFQHIGTLIEFLHCRLMPWPRDVT